MARTPGTFQPGQDREITEQRRSPEENLQETRNQLSEEVTGLLGKMQDRQNLSERQKRRHIEFLERNDTIRGVWVLYSRFVGEERVTHLQEVVKMLTELKRDMLFYFKKEKL